MASNSNRLPPNRAADPEVGLHPQSRRKTVKQRVEESMARRSRTASDGSTFAAFFAHEEKVNPVVEAAAAPSATEDSSRILWGRRKRQLARQQKSPPRKSKVVHPSHPAMPTKTTSNTGSDLGDVAAMAIAGLGNDIDVSELMAGPSPLLLGSKPKAGRKGQLSPQMAGHRVSQLPTILDGTVQNYEQPFQLPDELTARRQTGHGPGNRRSTNIFDSLRFSEASNYFEQDMLTQFAQDDSMFLSERSDGGFVAQLRSEMGVPSSRDTLIGSSILDRQSFGSLYKASTLAEVPPSSRTDAPNQKEEIASFAAMLQSFDYGAVAPDKSAHPPKLDGAPVATKARDDSASMHAPSYSTAVQGQKEAFENELEDERDEAEERISFLMSILDPASFLMREVKFTAEGFPYFDNRAEWTIAGFIRWLLFNPISPEFTSLQLFCWAVLLGVAMGFYTAFWKKIIEHSVEFMWKELPEALLENGLFTDLDGSFPLYHYMWICPAFWGGVLSYIFAILPTPIPGQVSQIEKDNCGVGPLWYNFIQSCLLSFGL
jgi:hypothetical protein